MRLTLTGNVAGASRTFHFNTSGGQVTRTITGGTGEYIELTTHTCVLLHPVGAGTCLSLSGYRRQRAFYRHKENGLIAMQRVCLSDHRMGPMLRKDHQGLCFRFTPFVLAAVLVVLLCGPCSMSFAREDEPDESVPVLHLTLTEAIRLALADNRDLQGIQYNLAQQGISLQSSLADFDITYRPESQLTMTDGAELARGGVRIEKRFQYGMRAAVSPAVSWSDSTNSGEVGLSLGIPLFRGFGKKVAMDGVYGSQFSLRSAERSLYNSKVNTVLATVYALYDIIKQQELVTLYQFQIDQFKGHSAMARMKEKVGLATPIDVYRAEIRLKDAESALGAARESLKNAEDGLKLILALPIEKPITVSAPLAYEPVRLDPETAVSISLDNRIELVQKEDDIREAERRADISKHNLLPQLDLILDYRRFELTDALGDITGLGEERWGVSLAGMTDWTRKNEKYSYQQSLIGVKSARLSLETAKDEIITGVRRQLESLKEALERVEIKTEQIRQAEGKLALSKIQFAYGMASNFDVIEAETELQRGKVDLLSSKIDYIEGTFEMRAVLGTLIERPEG